MTQRLKGKSALITGSTSNIGRAAAVVFAGDGAHVIVSGRDDTRGAAVLAEIRAAGGVADYVHADLDGTAEASRALADAATGLLGGRIDILVNNAGIFPAANTLTADSEMFDRVYAVSPGVIRDHAIFVDSDHPAARMMAGTPAGRTGNPDEVASAMLYLASDEASFVQGAVLDVDGGRTEVAVIAG
jgi:NAD(P)-dependent dehydrogenase (short-subunit alcohol dehydrogenase family)